MFSSSSRPPEWAGVGSREFIGQCMFDFACKVGNTISCCATLLQQVRGALGCHELVKSTGTRPRAAGYILNDCRAKMPSDAGSHSTYWVVHSSSFVLEDYNLQSQRDRILIAVLRKTTSITHDGNSTCPTY